MRVTKKIVAVILSLLTLLSVGVFSASAATAPEFSISVLSETANEVTVRLTLEKGEFNSFEATFITSSAIGNCKSITMNSGAFEMSLANPDTNKFTAACATKTVVGKTQICDAVFAKKSSAPITKSDISVSVGACSLSVKINGRLENQDIKNLVKVDVKINAFTLNETSVAMNYKDSHTIDYSSEYAPEKLTWTSSNEKVATVDENGNIYASGKGNATITVTSADGVVNETIDVTVSYTVLQWIIIIVLFGWIWY